MSPIGKLQAQLDSEFAGARSFVSKFRVELKFSIEPDKDVRNRVVEYDLLIHPILMKYNRHSTLEMPIDEVDEGALATWTDERILEFVRTNIALQGDDFVADQIASAA